MRISLGTKWRTQDTAPLEAAITSMVASPSDKRVDDVVADRQQGAQAEQLHQPGVLLDEAVVKQAAEFVHRHHAAVSFLGGAANAARCRAK